MNLVRHFITRHELTAGGMLDGSGDAHLDAELVGPMRLALADALDLGRMQRLDLAPALMPVLGQHTAGQAPGEDLLQSLARRDAPSDVADDPAEMGLQLA